MDMFIRPVVIHPGGELALMSTVANNNMSSIDMCLNYCLSIFGIQVCFYRHDRDYQEEEDFDLLSFFMVTD